MVIAIICGILAVIAVFGLINSLNQNKAINKNPEYATEKALKEYLEKSSIGFMIKRKARLRYENGNAYFADFRYNGALFAPLLNEGAKMVFVSGSNPDHPRNAPVHIFALTPKMIIQKTMSSQSKPTVTSQKANLATIYTHKYEVFSHGTKNASVASRAAAGAVIGGAAGAVVGAASASSVNAKGGKTVVTGSDKRCCIKFMDQIVDCIIISTELIEKYGEPENVKFEADKTGDYYMYVNNFVGDIANYDNYRSLSDYVYKLITEIKK